MNAYVIIGIHPTMFAYIYVYLEWLYTYFSKKFSKRMIIYITTSIDIEEQYVYNVTITHTHTHTHIRFC